MGYSSSDRADNVDLDDGSYTCGEIHDSWFSNCEFVVASRMACATPSGADVPTIARKRLAQSADLHNFASIRHSRFVVETFFPSTCTLFRDPNQATTAREAPLMVLHRSVAAREQATPITASSCSRCTLCSTISPRTSTRPAWFVLNMPFCNKSRNHTTKFTSETKGSKCNKCMLL